MSLYVFDLDHTLLTKNSSFQYYSYLCKQKIFPYRKFFSALRFLIKYLYFNLSPSELHKQVFSKFLKNKGFDEIFGCVDNFLEFFLNKHINKKIFSFIEQALKDKSEVMVLSNSPQYLVAPICRRLNIDNCKGSIYNIDENKKFIDIEHLMDGEAKAKYIASIKNKDIIVFTDSIWDKPLLDIAKKCYIINPDKKLFRLALEKGWNIL